MLLRRIRRVATAGVVVMAVLLLAVSVLATRRDGEPGNASVLPAPLAAGDPVERTAPPLRLIDEHGKPTALSAFRGKWVILAPSMTLCNEVCPLTTGALMQVQSELAQAGLAHRVVIAEVTVDPWRDTPARLRAYRRLTGADFDLLTGTQAEIRRFWKFFGVYYKRVPEGNPPDIDWLTHKPETMDVEHTDGLFFLDPAGHERIAVVGMPDVNGKLSPALLRLLDGEGRQDLAHPQLPWNAAQVLDDLYWLMGKEIPASALPKVSPPSAAAAKRVLAGSPSPLAALHDQAAQLLGGFGELRTRLSQLRGYPVVLNVWASWCPPCRAEFPIFAAASALYGRQVAFLGADTEDTASAASAFLAKHPVSYPSYQTSSASLDSLASIEGTPTTIYISRAGKVLYAHPGQYETEATLDDDIARYALGR